MVLPMNLFYDPAKETEKRPNEKWADRRWFRILKSWIGLTFDLKGRLKTWWRAILGHNYKLLVSDV